MAKIDQVSDRLAAISERLARVEATLSERQRSTAWIPGAAIAIALAGLGWCWHLDRVVTTLQTGGNPQLLAQLKNPSSIEQLRADLSVVSAQAQQARLKGTTPDVQKLKHVSELVSSLIQQRPGLPEAWQAASSLVNVRPASFDESALPPGLAVLTPPSANLGNCLSRPMTYMQNGRGPVTKNTVIIDALAFHDCTVGLDDVASFLASSQYQTLKKAGALKPKHLFVLSLVRVHIIYKGGQLLPVSAINMYGCTFDLQIPTEPSSDARIFTSSILDEVPNRGDIQVHLRSA